MIKVHWKSMGGVTILLCCGFSNYVTPSIIDFYIILNAIIDHALVPGCVRFAPRASADIIEGRLVMSVYVAL